jgi:23S rRNA (guanosine2251-2'-O)-methyltransferase
MAQREFFLILEDIRSVYNVGSIFRTADAAGVSKIFLVGVTPTPVDRFGRIRPDLAKVALGAEQMVAWEYMKSILPLVTKLKKEGFSVLALEQDVHSVDYKKIKIQNKTALVVGNEVEGVSKAVLKKADTICEIPMRGKKESLNVSVSTGITLFRLLDR